MIHTHRYTWFGDRWFDTIVNNYSISNLISNRQTTYHMSKYMSNLHIHHIHHMHHIKIYKVLDIYGQYVKGLTNHYIYAMQNMLNIRFGQYKGLEGLKGLVVFLYSCRATLKTLSKPQTK